jgi:hypothetical protein
VPVLKKFTLAGRSVERIRVPPLSSQTPKVRVAGVPLPTRRTQSEAVAVFQIQRQTVKSFGSVSAGLCGMETYPSTPSKE